MDNLIKDIEVVDEIGKATDMAIDIMCLSQEIRNVFFHQDLKQNTSNKFLCGTYTKEPHPYLEY